VPDHGSVQAGNEVQLGDVLRGIADQARQVPDLRMVGERGAHHGLDGLVVARPDLLDLRHCQCLHR
jgi:hypothetical protein